MTAATYTNLLVGLEVSVEKLQFGKVAAFFWGLMHLPRGGGEMGRWGEGVSGAGAGGSADPGEAIGGTSWILLSTARSPAYQSLELFIGCMER